MLTFTEAQLLGWISPLLWPFLRVLALFGAMPVLSQGGVPMRVRVALALLVAVCAQASLPAMPVVPLDSAQAVLLVVQQLVIGCRWPSPRGWCSRPSSSPARSSGCRWA
jgi:flagellar biosynthetic protein FliR